MLAYKVGFEFAEDPFFVRQPSAKGKPTFRIGAKKVTGPYELRRENG